MRLLGSSPAAVTIREPLIGLILGAYPPSLLDLPAEAAAGRALEDFRADPDFFFSSAYADNWLPPLRNLLLARMGAQIPLRAHRCIVNEPNGSDGAKIIMRALPKARMIFLIRDGRDVIDSLLDAWGRGAWLEQAFAFETEARDRSAFIRAQAYRWVWRMQACKAAFDLHPTSNRWIVHYERLRADPLGELRALHQHFDWDVPSDLVETVDRLSFENVPSEQKGRGKVKRAAQPGLWRTSLSPDEIALCMSIMAPTLRAFGYE